MQSAIGSPREIRDGPLKTGDKAVSGNQRRQTSVRSGPYPALGVVFSRGVALSARGLLVTGGAGFIGANFVYYWLKTFPRDRIVVLDSLTYAANLVTLEPLRSHPQFRFVLGDIRNRELVEQLLTDENLSVIVNFAAESHVDRSVTGPDGFIDTNVVGTHSLLKAARACWLDGKSAVSDHLFHQISTDEVFGSLQPHDPPFTERNPYCPNSPYSASKAASDHLVRAYHHTYGLRTTTTHCSNNYGPYQFPEKLIPLCIRNMLSGHSLPIYGDGRNIRDWLYVEDHCVGIRLVIEHGRVGETYNIGTNNEWSNIDIVKCMCGIVDQHFARDGVLARRYPRAPAANGRRSEELITFVTDRPGHDRRYAVDAKRVTTELGYKPQESFDSGIRRTISWYLQNESWWQQVL